ncbi:hypothetical protein D3C74_500680 [compost metagenome]
MTSVPTWSRTVTSPETVSTRTEPVVWVVITDPPTVATETLACVPATRPSPRTVASLTATWAGTPT